ncbi:origin recognition complex subunit 3 [Halyomorpha halys]|uniref:origin recognition complex subunit 3 n=1 Tax=Halyomorpha halys TaxID=286706 RepID=UPI0006D4F7D8|nr:origin recognition complex subunit 3 [Halyomorpha halys]
MDTSDSVSKGFFIHNPKNDKRKHQDPLSEIVSEDWYRGYSKVWRSIEKRLSNIEDDAMQALLKDLVNFIKKPHSSINQIPTVILLTGVNLPDHSVLFNKFRHKLRKDITHHVVMLSSNDCTSIKHTVEHITCQFMKKSEDAYVMDIDDSDSEISDTHLKKSDCNLHSLVNWYNNLKRNRSQLVIVLKDFEGFQTTVVSQLILILSGYLEYLPITLVFGVATTEAAVGESLSHKITSRLNLKVFQSQPSVYFLNNTVNKVLLSSECPFQLSGKLFNFFTSIFLFYDFSVNRFIQGVKYCVMDHFYNNKVVSLLCRKEMKLMKYVSKLDNDCLKEIREIPSFKKFIEDSKDDKLVTDDDYTKEEILKQLLLLRRAIKEFYSGVHVLYKLVKGLPQAPLGKQFREVYCTAMSKDITKTSEYKECNQILLKFLSKDELESMLKEILCILKVGGEGFCWAVADLKKLNDELQNIGLNPVSNIEESPTKIDLNVKNRSQLRKKLAEMSSKGPKKVGYEIIREKIIDFLMASLIPSCITPYTEWTVLWELVTIRDKEARNKVVPRIRGPIHTALNNPHQYLLCDCCKLEDDAEILPTMPDICIAYKLHLEGGPLINLYDWLQSFSTIINPGRSLDNADDVDPTTQARFTQAVAELEFLGFIKSSKAKPDHVTRLTWGTNK